MTKSGVSGFRVLYHPAVWEKDLPSIDAGVKRRIRKAIETRIMTDPLRYGLPLRKDLKGRWKLRVGDYRIVYLVDESTVTILGIYHRSKIYSRLKDRV